jgi:L-fuculose-phosphate aldolase
MMDEREQIVEVCKRLNGKNLLASADGNVSVRLDESKVLITPSGVNKARISKDDIATVTLANEVIKGHPSGERLMHLAVYKHCAKAKAVVHAHPPTAIAFTLAKPEWKEIPGDSMSELILAMGRIPIAPYARPGTQDMGDVLQPFLPACRVILLARHGAISWGEDLEEAYNGMERLEHICQILKSAMELGGASPLPAHEVSALWELRKKLGDRTL